MVRARNISYNSKDHKSLEWAPLKVVSNTSSGAPGIGKTSLIKCLLSGGKEAPKAHKMVSNPVIAF